MIHLPPGRIEVRSFDDFTTVDICLGQRGVNAVNHDVEQQAGSAGYLAARDPCAAQIFGVIVEASIIAFPMPRLADVKGGISRQHKCGRGYSASGPLISDTVAPQSSGFTSATA